MAGAEGAVIACHATDEFNAQMCKGKQAGKLVIIDFMSPTCPGCIMIAPVYAQWAKQFPSAIFLEVNVYELKEVADLYEIERIPTCVFTSKKGETVQTIVGPDEDAILEAIKKYIGTPAAASAASA